MDLPALSFSFHHHNHNGLRLLAVCIKGIRHDAQGALREASTRQLKNFLIMLDEAHGIFNIQFEEIYLEPASVLALKLCLRRHATRQRYRCRVAFKNCCGALEMALWTALKMKCPKLAIISQHLNFAPRLVDALSNTSSLKTLAISKDSLDETDMKRLALCLCHNQHIKHLLLSQAFQGDASIVAFASCMHGMTSLRKIQLVGNEFGALGEQALFKVLEEAKTSVNALRLDGKPDHVQAHIDFLLRLKQKGGRSYIGTCTTSTTAANPNQWIELLDEFKADTNALYYILCADPGRMNNRKGSQGLV